MLGSTLVTMTGVDALFVNEWPFLLEHLNITIIVKDIESLDPLVKGLDSLEKWKVFYNTYSKWISLAYKWMTSRGKVN